MARRVVVQLVDDLDGGEIADGVGGTVRFAPNQVDYEIDLSAQHGEQLRDVLQPCSSGLGRCGPRSDIGNATADGACLWLAGSAAG